MRRDGAEPFEPGRIIDRGLERKSRDRTDTRCPAGHVYVPERGTVIMRLQT